jgi:hypothetical protein
VTGGRWALPLVALGATACPALVEDDFTVVSAGRAEGGSSGTGGSEESCGTSAAPVSSDCPAVCTSCSEGTCVIACDEKDECKQAVLACPEGLNCEVSCSGEAACNDAVIQCAEGPACRLLCSNVDACKKASLVCRGGPCTVECGGVQNACRDATIHCDTNACAAECLGSVEAPRLECGDACLCQHCEQRD